MRAKMILAVGGIAVVVALLFWAVPPSQAKVPDGFSVADAREWIELYRQQNEVTYYLRRGEIVQLFQSLHERALETIDHFTPETDGTVTIHLRTRLGPSIHSYSLKRSGETWLIWKESR